MFLSCFSSLLSQLPKIFHAAWKVPQPSVWDLPQQALPAPLAYTVTFLAPLLPFPREELWGIPS